MQHNPHASCTPQKDTQYLYTLLNLEGDWICQNRLDIWANSNLVLAIDIRNSPQFFVDYSKNLNLRS